MKKAFPHLKFFYGNAFFLKRREKLKGESFLKLKASSIEHQANSFKRKCRVSAKIFIFLLSTREPNFFSPAI